MKKFLWLGGILVVFLGTALIFRSDGTIITSMENEPKDFVGPDGVVFEVATLAGGCFWCIEAPFQNTDGVLDVVSGYAGGTKETATYAQVSGGKTNHREAVQVFFDPKKISYQDILDLFWRQIDPTDDGGQFADRGPQYRTAIFTHSKQQAEQANISKLALQDSQKFETDVVTEVLPYTTFFLAEDYHQDYFKKAKDHYEQYKKASGRSGFLEENWAKDAALEYSKKDN